MEINFFKDKKVLVMGLGRFGGGVDSAKFLAQAGAKVIVTDLAKVEELSDSIDQLKAFPQIQYHLGSHVETDFIESDIVVANPAVPFENKYLETARKNKRLVTSQIGIFFELCPAKIIGITGANGKSTTTALTAHLLRAGLNQKNCEYTNVWLGGNIGNEPLLVNLEKIKNTDLVVLELSSFQVEQLALIKKMPHIALLTNLTPNHLDRYKTFEKYCAAKELIFSMQNLNDSPVSIFNCEDKIACQWFEKYRNDFGRKCIKFSADDVPAEIREQYNLPGRIYRSNLAAAMTIAKSVGISEETVTNCLSKFKGLPHRLELVEKIDGILFYNDSKATTPDSTIVALESFDNPEILIAGGYDKGIPFTELGKKISEKVKLAVLIGQTSLKIAEAIGNSGKTKIHFAKSLAQAVNIAKDEAEKGDVVLLSTACASYDMFDNYEHRGVEFCRLVRQLKKIVIGTSLKNLKNF